MSEAPAPRISITEGRFARFERIDWWDQKVLRAARVLVVGAGALGNEIVKNLALVGVGHVVIVDMDTVELSNLSRSVLFRERDEGWAKSVRAAEAARAIYPELAVRAIVGDVTADVGLGVFRWADVILGALDNREARVFVNAAAARVGRPWIDGGIDVFQGIVRGFAPPASACYECTMSEVDWELLNRRRSCSLIARRAAAHGGQPTTPITASVIGALEVQEAIKYLHGIEPLAGRGFVFDARSYDCFVVSYPIEGSCGWHQPSPPIETRADLDSDSPLRAAWDVGVARLGDVDALELAREIVERLGCPTCKTVDPTFLPPDRVPEERLLCGACGTERVPVIRHSIPKGSEWLALSAREIGLPPRDIVWARRGESYLGIEIAGDDVLPTA